MPTDRSAIAEVLDRRIPKDALDYEQLDALTTELFTLRSGTRARENGTWARLVTPG